MKRVRHRDKRMLSRSLCTSKKFSNPRLNDSDRNRFVLELVSADDDGRLDGCPISLKMECFPGLPYTIEEITESLNRQHEVGLILWYKVEGQKIIQITGWNDHQNFHGYTRYPSIYPPFGQPETQENGEPSQPETSENGLTIPKDKIREDKIRKEAVSKKAFADVDAIFISLAEILKEKILSWKPNHKPITSGTVTKWSATLRLMVTVDGRTPEQIRDVMNWLYAEGVYGEYAFVVESAESLRAKYDRIETAMKKKPRQQNIEIDDGVSDEFKVEGGLYE